MKQLSIRYTAFVQDEPTAQALNYYELRPQVLTTRFGEKIVLVREPVSDEDLCFLKAEFATTNVQR